MQGDHRQAVDLLWSDTVLDLLRLENALAEAIYEASSLIFIIDFIYITCYKAHRSCVKASRRRAPAGLVGLVVAEMARLR